MNRERKTMPLTGTVTRTQANLDAASAFAVDYAQAFLRSQGDQAVSSSAVIRRALSLYVKHLQGHHEPLQELRQVSRVSRSALMNKDNLKEAAERFQNAQQEASRGTLPGSFVDLLYGPSRLDMEATTARADGLTRTAVKGWRCRPRKGPGEASN